MSKRVDFYTISLWGQSGITDYRIEYLFESIQAQLQNEERNIQVVRRIGDRWIRLFPFIHTLNMHQMVIPFGKLKDKNKPYWLNEENHLEEIPAELYDINSLGYDLDYKVMILTTNKQGPSYLNIEEYLNTFIPKNTGLRVKIEPIIYSAGIEQVRNACLVRSVTLKLDLGHSLNNFYLEQIADNKNRTLLDALHRLAQVAKQDGESKILSLTLGLGKFGKKDDTLNLDSMLGLLENINIDRDFVTEIEVNYKDGTDEKIDKARLKQSCMFLNYTCRCEETQVSPEKLLENINDAVAERVIVITRHAREYFVNIAEYEGERFEIIKTWNNNE